MNSKLNEPNNRTHIRKLYTLLGYTVCWWIFTLVHHNIDTLLYRMDIRKTTKIVIIQKLIDVHVNTTDIKIWTLICVVFDCTLYLLRTSSLFLLDIYTEVAMEVFFFLLCHSLTSETPTGYANKIRCQDSLFCWFVCFSPCSVPGDGAASVAASMCICNKAKQLLTAGPQSEGGN